MPEPWSPMPSPAAPGSPPSASTTSATQRDARAREPLRLEEWQRDFWWEALEVDPVTGLRVYSEVGLGLPRKKGKSVQASAAGLYFLVADGEAEPEVYVAAAARNQTGIVLGQSRRMAQQSPRLSRHVTVRTTLIECPRNGGIMRSLSADAALQHGLNLYANIIDCDDGSTPSGAGPDPIIDRPRALSLIRRPCPGLRTGPPARRAVTS